MGHKIGITTNQLLILKLLYKFRFATPNLISKYRNISISSINQSLNILLKRGLIERKYSNRNRIAGKPASYYLTSAGINVLGNNIRLNDLVVHSYYHNKKVSESFIDQHLAVLEIYIVLGKSYPGLFNIFTAADSRSLEYLPEIKPSLYLSRIDKSVTPRHYFLEVINDDRTFIIKKKLNEYIEHYSSATWDKDEYPTLLVVLPSQRAEKRLGYLVESQSPDFDIYTTTALATKNSGFNNRNIWSDVLEPENLVSL